MPIPTAYSEAELAQFAVTQLGDLATALGWVPETPQVAEAVNDALVGYFGGSGAIADATDVPKLRALGRVAVWRAAARATAGHYRFGADQMSFDRQQVHEHAVAMLGEAEREAAVFGVGAYALVVTPVQHTADPYAYVPDELRVLP